MGGHQLRWLVVALIAVAGLCDAQVEPPPPPSKTCDKAGNCNGHGTCTPTVGGGSCECHGEYGGAKCDEKPCDGHNDCKHGTCANNGAYHKCNCECGWTGTTCSSRKECPATPPPAHTHWTCPDSHFESKCTAHCNEGWTGGSITSAEYTCACQGGMHWAGAPLTCIGIPCSTTAVAHAHINAGPRGKAADALSRGRFPGADVTFSCNDGWYMSAGSAKNKCRPKDGH
eukprot:COSAG05_NODE_5577_length_1136_cov_2.377049_1_plen_227_part_01